MVRSVVLAGAVFMACGPAAEQTSFVGDNNTALLTGASVGSGSSPNDLLRKPLTVNVTGPSSAWPVARAFVLRANPTTESVSVVVEVSNAGRSGRCLIRASDLELKDAAGATLKVGPLAFVQGSVGDLGNPRNPIVTDTCLAPGETGFLLELYTASPGERLFSQAESLVFRWSDASSTLPLMPKARLTPTRYSVTPSGAVSVAFTNTGTGQALLGEHFSRFFLLDAEGRPLFFAFLTSQTTPPGGLVPVGSDGSVEGAPRGGGYEGAATALRVLMDFDLPAPNGLVGASQPDTPSDEQRLARWTEAQLRKR
ncbi:MAG: hypothetical protein SFW67_22060 [Myxococcaceae bacterium]|nr:hypothetical protein [Myxococcaceae bacterium]